MNFQNNIPIFFIICKGRSGSTLLANLLDSSPNVLVPFENTFLMHLYPKYKKVKLWDKITIDHFLDDLYILHKTKKNWKINKEELRNKLYSQLNKDTSYGSICQLTYLSFQSIFLKKEILIIGDKNPFYTFCINDIKEIYPDAKFIHLIRDARANVRSHIVSFKTKFLSFIAWKWFYYIDEVEEKKEKHLDSFITIKYEDLVQDPEETLASICNFLEIKFNAESLDFHKVVSKKLTHLDKFRGGIHSNLTKPINTSINNKWKDFFNKKQINTINFICQKYLTLYKYRFKPEPINFFKRLEIFTGKIYYKVWIKIVKAFYAAPFFIKKMVFNVISIVFR